MPSRYPSLATVCNEYFAREASSRYETAEFTRVEAEHANDSDYHARYWWSSSGYALAVLLEKSGYSSYAQYQLLEFFWAITPSLGPAFTLGKQRWKSFMTDDHNPIELSWDWQDGTQSPRIRLSLEPIGIYAGLPIDPYNSSAGLAFRQTMAQLLPSINQKWLSHFQRQLHVQGVQYSAEGHQSTEFYGFDLNDNGIVGKAYFFPTFKARATERSCFDIISDVIRTAPDSIPCKLHAFDVFQGYVKDPSTPSLEMEMLAIDLVESAKSRFKVYFRIRDVSFSSLKDTLTLGGRLWTPDMEKGLARLQPLFNALLGRGAGDRRADERLPLVNHRTAGLLFYVQFRHLDEKPAVKAYLPVRHYAQSDKAVVSALQDYLCQDSAGPSARANATNYTDAITTIFSSEALNKPSGLHTYIGCSVDENGKIRLISYINPRYQKFAQSGSAQDRNFTPPYRPQYTEESTH